MATARRLAGRFHQWINTGSLIRYLMSGVTTTLIYVGLTLLLNSAAGVPIGIAIAVSYALAITVHFLLQRHFVFASDAGFHVSTRDQIMRYVVIGVVQVTITWISTHYLPSLLGLSQQVVYVLTVGVISACTFLLLRFHVFAPADLGE
jgi:putative flippase GtrA